MTDTETAKLLHSIDHQPAEPFAWVLSGDGYCDVLHMGAEPPEPLTVDGGGGL